MVPVLERGAAVGAAAPRRGQGRPLLGAEVVLDPVHAALALAGYYLKHSDALLAGAGATPEEGLLDFSEFPSEAQRLIQDWQLGDQVVLA